ncbi:mitochondrial fission ELM1 family protein [Methylosinus sp. Sm6]|uniref:mitochondrial fission ELM1 family protein n=1 Tax=Methylosinus sp. Sm6 TaxID=2866948 RepID=UPI00351D26A5
MGVAPRLVRIAPRRLIAALAPFGPIDPREASLVAPPFPDLVIACGRRTIPYLRHVKRASGGAAFTVYVNKPATGQGTADLIVAPRHDGSSGADVLTPLTPPNRLTPQLLAQARAAPDPRVGALSGPVAGLLVGGDSRHFRFSERDVAELAAAARGLLDEGWSVAATLSRRTPARLAAALRQRFADSTGAPPSPARGRRRPDEVGSDEGPRSFGEFEGWRGPSSDPAARSHLLPRVGEGTRAHIPRAFLWDGEGENPYLSILACSDALLVTGDSVNMVAEAAATGAPVHVFAPGGGSAKIAAFLAGLEARGAARPWTGRMERWSYEPVNSTPGLAEEIARAYRRFAGGARFA